MLNNMLGVQKKRKLGTSLLVLGTGGGDVLALDVSAGQLKWRVNDCHPGCVFNENLLPCILLYAERM